jgi:dihydrolipoyl dehydrogenase
MAPKETYDLIIIGSGPGGYVAAARASQLGLKVACIEKEAKVGGVCLNVGCIPSKALLDSSEYFYLAKTEFAAHGVNTGRISLDLAAMMARKEQVVDDLVKNVKSLLERSKVTLIQGTARLAGNKEVIVSTSKGKKNETVLQGNAILLATGSVPTALPGIPPDGKRIIQSTEALSLTSVPKHLIVAGGGYIGLELSSVWARLGAKVTVIEMMQQIAGDMDSQVARTLLRLLSKQGISFRMGTKVMAAKATQKKVKITISAKDKEETLDGDFLLMAVGRKPNTRALGLEDAGIETSPTGQVVVDDSFQTSVKGIYAIGDLIAGPPLAHKASAEGKAVAERIAGLPGLINYDTIPSIIYTAPEVAGVGLTKEEAKKREIPFCVGTYPFGGTGRARCLGQTDGFVKLISHAKTDQLLGAHILGPRASDLIGECVLAMEFGGSSEDIARTIHGHPTFSEAIMEAAMLSSQCSVYG